MNELKKLNRVVIKEELVALTGDFKLAIVLNQMIYWSERRSDADKFLNEEIEKLSRQSNSVDNTVSLLPSYGWIYKKAEELAEETMIGSSPKTILNYLNILIEKGYLQKRRNPRYDFDRTYQYRVNLIKIQTDLISLGYSLEGYDLGINAVSNTPNSSNLPYENTNCKNENTYLQNENCGETRFINNNKPETPILSSLPFENTYCKNENTNFQNERAIPETTITEITLKEEEEEERGSEDFQNTPEEINTQPELFTSTLDIDQISPDEIEKFAQHIGIPIIGQASFELYRKWRIDWEFSPEMIMMAGQLMTQLARVPNLGYIDSILQDWINRDVKSIQEANQVIKLFRASKSKPKSKTISGSKPQKTTNKTFYISPDEIERLQRKEGG